MKTDRTLLSIIVPCFNEGKGLDCFHTEMMKQMEMLNDDYDYEIIYVNDGSTDDTQIKVKGFAEKNSSVKYLCFSRNFGKESAMLAGMEYASGDCALILDADLQHPPELIHQP